MLCRSPSTQWGHRCPRSGGGERRHRFCQSGQLIRLRRHGIEFCEPRSISPSQALRVARDVVPTRTDEEAFALTTSGIRRETRRQIYEFICERGLATKKDIATSLDLSLPTVSKYLKHFVDANLLEPAAKFSPGAQGGRSPIAFGCVPDGRLAVGVDVTRDGISCLVVDLACEVHTHGHVTHTFERSEEYFAFVAEFIMSVIRDGGVDESRILGVGIAMPGLISESTGMITYGRVIDNYGMRASDFGRHLPFRTRLVHDSDAAGQAEFWPEDGPDNAFYVSLSRSVGGSVLVGGDIFRGDGEFAGEIGHLRIHTGGKLCYCGQHGCMDAYCNSSVLAHRAGGSLDVFFDRLSQGDPGIVEVWDTYTSDLAQAIHNIRVLFGCTIILGGDVGARIGDHIDGVRSKVDQQSFLATHSEGFLLPSTCTREPVATGAALYLVDEFKQSLGPLPPEQTRPVKRRLRRLEAHARG